MTGALNWMMKSNRWVVVNNHAHKDESVWCALRMHLFSGASNIGYHVTKYCFYNLSTNYLLSCIIIKGVLAACRAQKHDISNRFSNCSLFA